LGAALEAGCSALVEQDNAEAARWFSHAAAQGDAAAVRALNRIRAAAQSR
jgi:TPR repeat protein